MGIETATLMPAVLLGIMVALTLILLPHLDETRYRRSDEPTPAPPTERAADEPTPDEHV